jgi:hypothetical protein
MTARIDREAARRAIRGFRCDILVSKTIIYTVLTSFFLLQQVIFIQLDVLVGAMKQKPGNFSGVFFLAVGTIGETTIARSQWFKSDILREISDFGLDLTIHASFFLIMDYSQ